LAAYGLTSWVAGKVELPTHAPIIVALVVYVLVWLKVRRTASSSRKMDS
jgi:hypothetical protein